MDKHLSDFKEFLKKDVKPSIKELENLTSEKSRVHLQKLVFTNLVDRFDTAIDRALIDRIESEELLREIIKDAKPSWSEGDAIKMLLQASNPKEIAINRLKELYRSSIGRERHSHKLERLLLNFGLERNELRNPRVNPSKGEILNTFTVQTNSIPPSIIGYADWIYSKRNALVHGGGKASLLENDVKQIKKVFGSFEPAKGNAFKLQLSSIITASNFYEALINLESR
jgi:hypothetical protein